MGCFLACFGSSREDRKRRKSRHKSQRPDQRNAGFKPAQAAVLSERNNPEKPSNPVSGIRNNKPEKQLNVGLQKKATFNSAVTAREHVSAKGSAEFCVDKEDGGKREGKEENLVVKPKQSQPSSGDNSIALSSGSYPSSRRYPNCRYSDDELYYGESGEDDDIGASDFDALHQDDEILRSGPKVAAAKVTPLSTEEPGNLPAGEAKPNQDAPYRSDHMHSVLNPVENLIQLNAVKTKETLPSKQQKENHSPVDEPQIRFSSEPSFREFSSNLKAKPEHSKKSSQEIAVGSSESTPINKTGTINSDTVTPERSTLPLGSSPPSSFEDRPILGALTVEELKQFSVSSSPRRSPVHSPDERPIIGTVGTYWNHSVSSNDDDSFSASSFKGIPNTTNKYREDKIVNWHSTPFEIRLERALNECAAGSCHTPTASVHPTITR